MTDVRRWLVLGAALVLLFGTGCLRPMEERARRDLEVGRDAADGVSVEVDDGLAAVRRLSSTGLVLWSSAPAFRMTVTVDREIADFQIEIRNAMVDAELEARTASGRSVERRALDGPRPTVKRWSLVMPGNERVRLEIGPENWEARERFVFGVLSDIQEAVDRVEDVFLHMNRHAEMRFLLGAGDLTQRGSASELERFQKELETLDVPYYTTLGNHELGTSPVVWHDYFGRASFRFRFHQVQFSMIDSGSAAIDPLVYGWLDRWLEEAKADVHVVAMHIPPIDPVGVRNGSFGSRNEAARLLARLARGRVDLTLYGHIHSYYGFRNAGIEAHISGGGGAIPERFDGIGRHYLLIDMDPDEGNQRTTVMRVD